MSAELCPYCYEEMYEPEISNGSYVDPWHCYACLATQTDWRDMNLARYSPRELQVGFAFGELPVPDALGRKALTMKEYLEELAWHVNSSSK